MLEQKIEKLIEEALVAKVRDETDKVIDKVANHLKDNSGKYKIGLGLAGLGAYGYIRDYMESPLTYDVNGGFSNMYARAVKNRIDTGADYSDIGATITGLPSAYLGAGAGYAAKDLNNLMGEPLDISDKDLNTAAAVTTAAGAIPGAAIGAAIDHPVATGAIGAGIYGIHRYNKNKKLK